MAGGIVEPSAANTAARSAANTAARSAANTAARVLAYPAIVGGALVLAHAAMKADVPVWFAVPATTALAGLAVAGFERWLPFRQAWLDAHGDVATDALHLLSSTAGWECGSAMAAAAVAGSTMAAAAVAGVAAQAAGYAGTSALDVWPDAWPLAAQVALALVVAEFGVYWIHRVQHERGGWLWRLHATHHTAPRIYWLSIVRNHPLDALITAIVALAPVYALGAGEHVLALQSVYLAAHGFLQHGNVDVRLGPLNRILSMAEVHRWHHSRIVQESNANYGQTLLLWDHLFGTHRMPLPHAPAPDVGLAGSAAFPTSWWGQLASPWRASLWRSTAGRDLPWQDDA